MFRSMLTYKAADAGRGLVVADRLYPSSQTCSVCGRRDGKKPLKAAALADAPRERDFHDLASILGSTGWSLDKVADCLAGMGRADQVNAWWATIRRFQDGEFDTQLHQAGFNPDWCHMIID